MTEQNKNDIELYIAADGSMQLDVRFDAETVWLSQRQMAELFDTSSENIIMHHIYGEGELDEAATAKDYLAVHMEGRRQVKRQIKHCNLDAIIGVGYRVNSKHGTQFRINALPCRRRICQ